MPYKTAIGFLETFIMVSQTYITFGIRFILTFLAETLFVKKLFFAHLFIHFIALASLYLSNHESFQRTA